jgi:hypothetical protein
MDSMVSTAARALAVGDPIRALQQIALRHDPPALALRGIAMAQLGDLGKAAKLLSRAERSFGPQEALARARCVTARAEVALLSRDLKAATRGLSRALLVLERSADRDNALFARVVWLRRLLLLGRLDEAQRQLSLLALDDAPPRLVACAELLVAEVEARKLRAGDAEAALARARRAAVRSQIPSLLHEVEQARTRFAAPAARVLVSGSVRLVGMAELGALLGSSELVVDACRREVRADGAVVALVRRPVLFGLVEALARSAPDGESRARLIEQVFGARRPNDSHRARLRVELGRLRRALGRLASVSATPDGYVLTPAAGARTLLVLPPEPGEVSALTSLLAGGEAWSTSALALAVGRSQRAVQRALATLEEQGKVRGLGAGRARRWVRSPGGAFATSLLLVAPGSLS